jgi:hypothetical protein
MRIASAVIATLVLSFVSLTVLGAVVPSAGPAPSLKPAQGTQLAQWTIGNISPIKGPACEQAGTCGSGSSTPSVWFWVTVLSIIAAGVVAATVIVLRSRGRRRCRHCSLLAEQNDRFCARCGSPIR